MYVVVVSDGQGSTYALNDDANSPLLSILCWLKVRTLQKSLVQQAKATVLSNKLSVLTSKLGLPNATIEVIAHRVSEILSTSGAIVHAPGHPSEAKMVIRRFGQEEKRGTVMQWWLSPVQIYKIVFSYCCCSKVQQKLDQFILEMFKKCQIKQNSL